MIPHSPPTLAVPFRRWLGWTLVIFLTSPFLVLLLWACCLPLGISEFSSAPSRLIWHEVASVFLFTLLQALASALGALILGLAGAYGIAAIPHLVGKVCGVGFARRHAPLVTRVVETSALLPNLVPVLLLILAALKFLPGVRGFWGIIVLHVLLNLGLVSVTVVGLLRRRIGGLAELARVEGASRVTFFWRVVLPILRSDLLSLGLFVFALSFSSFAIPLVIGGSRGMTVEVLIYRAMRVDADWSSALILAFLQMSAILFISIWLRHKTTPARPRGSELQLLMVSSWPALPLVLVPTFLILTSLLDGVLAGWRQFWMLPSLVEALPLQIADSLLTGTLTGLLVALILLAFGYLRPRGRLRRWLLGYAAPSSVLVGLSLLIVWRATGVASLIKISLGLALIITPALYRMQWDGLLQSLEDQVRVACSLGADAPLIFREVMLPQLWGSLGALAGLASLWAWGDFALSTVIAERELTLALTAQALMDSYRLDVATVYIWMIAFGGLVSYALFTGVGRVLGSTTKM